MGGEKNNQAQKGKKKFANALMKRKIKAATNSTTLPSDSSMRVDAGEPSASYCRAITRSVAVAVGTLSGATEWHSRLLIGSILAGNAMRSFADQRFFLRVSWWMSKKVLLLIR